MTTREIFRRMRAEFVLEGGDDETLREVVDQVTASTYGLVATRPTLLSRGGRRVTTPRDLGMDVLYLVATAGKKPELVDVVFRTPIVHAWGASWYDLREVVETNWQLGEAV